MVLICEISLHLNGGVHMSRGVVTKRRSDAIKFKLTVIVMVALMTLGVWLLVAQTPFSKTASSATETDLLKSGWNYMPGVNSTSDGLRVIHLGRAIVQQDGAKGQLNSPVNLYGTHLDVSGDFTLSAAIKDLKGTAAFQLYNDAPVVQDEFRIEPKSIRLAISGETLTVSTWDEYAHQNLYKQTPSSTKHYTFTPQAENSITLERKGNRMNIGINNALIAALPRSANLSANSIWFGLEAEGPDDSWTLSGLSARPLGSGRVKAVNTQDIPIASNNAQALQLLTSNKRPGFLVGAAMALSPAVADTQYSNVAFNNFGSLTTENVLKWQFIHPQPNIYDFHEADALVDIATKNKLAVHGHTLVFGEANPQWVQDLPTVTSADKNHVKEVMIDHISQTVGHYKNKIISWDVVNEPLADYDTETTDGLRQHKWYEAMGQDYIATAFSAARQADPDAKLYINDFGLEEDYDRWDTLLALVAKLKSQGVPIDGVGFQAHVYESADKIDPNVLREHIRALAKIGLTARISEMDVYDDDGSAVQAKEYADALNVCMSEPNCVSWTTWGVSDKYDLWQDDNNVLQGGHTFLWDEKFSPKESVARIRSTLSNE